MRTCIIVLVAILLPTVASAQTLQQQIDTGVFQTNVFVMGLRNQVLQDQAKIAELMAELAATKKELATKVATPEKAAPTVAPQTNDAATP